MTDNDITDISRRVISSGRIAREEKKKDSCLAEWYFFPGWSPDLPDFTRRGAVSVACNHDFVSEGQHLPQRRTLSLRQFRRLSRPLFCRASRRGCIVITLRRLRTRETDPRYPIVRRFPIDLVSAPFTPDFTQRLFAFGCAPLRPQCNAVRLRRAIVSRVLTRLGAAIEIPRRNSRPHSAAAIDNDLIKSASCHRWSSPRSSIARRLTRIPESAVCSTTVPFAVSYVTRFYFLLPLAYSLERCLYD